MNGVDRNEDADSDMNITPNKRLKTGDDSTAGTTPSTANSSISYSTNYANNNHNQNDQESKNDDNSNDNTQTKPQSELHSHVDTGTGTGTIQKRKPFRKFRGVFSSNQAFHQLADQVVSNYNKQIQAEAEAVKKVNDQHASPGAISTNSAAFENKNNVTNHTSREGDDYDDDDCEIQVTDSNVTNPLDAYPHPRHLCAVHAFEAPFSNKTTTNQSLGHSESRSQNQAKNELYCKNCYCKVCDIPTKECLHWEVHCHACNTPEWDAAKKRIQLLAQSANVICLDDDSDDGNANVNVNVNSDGNADDAKGEEEELPALERRGLDLDNSAKDDSSMEDEDENDYGMEEEERLLEEMYRPNNYENHYDDRNSKSMDADLIGQKQRKDARITEVLAHNLRQLHNLSIADSSTANRDKKKNDATTTATATEVQVQVNKMEGDVTRLNLHKSFFVEGVRIGWPYPMIMPPQRQMAIHLTKAFKNKKHVVIESPTGTGKSAAILCSALAWQRYHAKTNDFGENVKIIYCSRTHSQVGQMVSSLRKTPYRPRMAILGSRDRLCIHKQLRPRNKVDGNTSGNKNNTRNVNAGCQIRVSNTESFRKFGLRNREKGYEDGAPPTSHPGDEAEDNGQHDNGAGSDEEGEPAGNRLERASSKMCPHYRQLTSESLAKKIHSTLVPDKQLVNCCSLGGEKTKLGTHDIEDLVDFGKQTNIKRGVALYRNPQNPSFGLKLGQVKGIMGSIVVDHVNESGAADKEGSIHAGDTIMSVDNVDVKVGKELSAVTRRIRETKDPLMLDVYSGETNDIDVNEYSEESACPYYLSRILAKNADIVFCPYNYVLDPNIRAAMDISVENSILILDEAHNVEDTLRQEGSGKFGEIEMLEMNVLLSSYANKWEAPNQRLDFGRRREDSIQDKLPDICHIILVFLDKIIHAVKQSGENFANDRGKNGVTSATQEYRKFKCPDDKEFEMGYFGPTGSGNGRSPVGCKGFFQRFKIEEKQIEEVISSVKQFQDHMSSKRGGNSKAKKNATLADRLTDLITMLCSAFKLSEHYYISTAVSANGNLDFAIGDGDGGNNRFARYKKNPKPIPQNPPPTNNDVQPRPRTCLHPSCNTNNTGRGKISHDTHCNGTTPKWESFIIINLLTPGILMAPLLRDCRSVVLASGSLAPLGSLCSELHLLPPSSSPVQPTREKNESEEKKETGDPLASTSGRLQIVPKPLEANHVISLPKQLLAVGIGHFPDGSPLSVKMANYSKPGFHDKLGDAIASIIESIPKGGVLVFFPSFSFLRKCVSTWQNNSTWGRLEASKGEVVVEPSSSQSEFEDARDCFNGTIRSTGSCILLAVFRGKMSEGVSFNDDFARGVICVGVPFPSSYDRSISAKMSYNNEQRRFRRKELLSGSDWYSQQAYRAVAQAIGRCIRHAADYGTIILLDNRHCDDGHSYNQLGICRAHANLPKWMRHSVRTLRKDRRNVGRSDLIGGWGALRRTMKTFFEGASAHSEVVLEKQKLDFKRKQEQTHQSQELCFDNKTRKWSSSQSYLSQTQSQSPLSSAKKSPL